MNYQVSEQDIIDRLLFSQIIEALYCYEESVLNSIFEANITNFGAELGAVLVNKFIIIRTATMTTL